LPRRLDHQVLGGVHQAWEQAAALLPALAFDPRAREVLGTLPLLSAGSSDLDDRHVKRAATLLGLLAHSYWRFGLERMFVSRNSDVPDDLPPAIEVPWVQVCRRLGRRGPGLTLEDWVFSNFTFTDPGQLDHRGDYDVADITNDTVRPAIPVYGNAVERVFTSAFVDVHAALAPVVDAVLRIEVALRHDLDGHTEVADSLEVIAGCAKRATRAFRRVSPQQRSPTFCDPTDWAKTLVTWTVPPPGWPAGPSGSATPFVHFYDAVIGRARYESRLGVFAAEMRSSQLARKHEVFCDLVRALDIRSYVERLRGENSAAFQGCVDAFDEVADAFAGQGGFLGVHKGKVVDYLGVGTVVGRNQSTAHDQTYVADSSWTAMADDLTDAMKERGVGSRGSTDQLPSTESMP